MICNKCGGVNPDDARFCGFCGQNFQQSPQAQAPVYQSFTGETLTYKQFHDRVASKSTKGWCTALAVVCFLTAAASLILLFTGNFLALLDIVFYLVMGILLLTTRRMAFALVPTVYSGVFSVVGLVSGGGVTGVFAIIAGIFATLGLSKVGKAYKEYQQTRVFPAEQL